MKIIQLRRNDEDKLIVFLWGEYTLETHEHEIEKAIGDLIDIENLDEDVEIEVNYLSFVKDEDDFNRVVDGFANTLQKRIKSNLN